MATSLFRFKTWSDFFFFQPKEAMEAGDDLEHGHHIDVGENMKVRFKISVESNQ